MPRNPENPRAVRPEWPEAQTDLLKRLWIDGKSGAQIAVAISDQFGVTLSRNSVIGKVHRLKLPVRDKASTTLAQKRGGRKTATKLAKDKRMAPRSKRVTLPPLPINRPEIIADGKPVKPSAYVALPGTTPIRLEQLGPAPRDGHANTCRWPIGENPTLFCGCATEKTYCPAHAAMAYRPIEKAKK